MNTLHQRLDEVSPPEIGESELKFRGTGLDRIQVRIADKLHQAAENLFGKTTEDNQIQQEAPNEAAKLKAQAGAWIHSSADYISQMEPEKVKADITEQVRRNPGRSLLMAGAAGLILGAIFRRK